MSILKVAMMVLLIASPLLNPKVEEQSRAIDRSNSDGYCYSQCILEVDLHILQHYCPGCEPWIISGILDTIPTIHRYTSFFSVIKVNIEQVVWTIDSLCLSVRFVSLVLNMHAALPRSHDLDHIHYDPAFTDSVKPRRLSPKRY